MHIATIYIAAYQHVGFAFSLQGFSAIASGYFSLNYPSPNEEVKINLSYTCNKSQDGFKFIVEKTGSTYKVYMTGAYSSTSGSASIIVQPGDGTTIGDGSETSVSNVNIYEQKALTPEDLASLLGGIGETGSLAQIVASGELTVRYNPPTTYGTIICFHAYYSVYICISYAGGDLWIAGDGGSGETENLNWYHVFQATQKRGN